MRIVDFMAFDLAWFTTPSGILLTLGVVLLIIGLIIVIISNKKEPKIVDNKNPDEGKLVIDENLGTTPTPTVYEAPPADMNKVDLTAQPEVSVEANVVDNSLPEITLTPASESETVALDPQVVESNNLVNETLPFQASVENTVMPEPTPVVEEKPMELPSTPIVIEETPVVEEKVAYGGANVEVKLPEENPSEKPVIYGGVDPLEKTAKIVLPSTNTIAAEEPIETPVVADVQPEIVAESIPVVVEPTPVVIEPTPVIDEAPKVDSRPTIDNLPPMDLPKTPEVVENVVAETPTETLAKEEPKKEVELLF